jgi:hypothetical protein
MVAEFKAPVELVELTDAELDAVAGGKTGTLIDVTVQDVDVVKDVNVNVNALNGGPVVNANR